MRLAWTFVYRVINYVDGQSESNINRSDEFGYMNKYISLALGILLIISLFIGCTGTITKFQLGDVVVISNWSDKSIIGDCIVSQEKNRDNYILQPVTQDLNGKWIKLAGTDIRLGSISFIDGGYKKIDHTTCP